MKSSSVTVTLSNVSNPMSISAQFYQLSLANLRSLSRAIKYKSDVRKINISKGKIQVLVVAKKKNECLYLTIPYDNGWKITNNGKRTSASQWLGGGGMTFCLGKGTNQLTFNYQLPLLRSGIFLSVVGVGLLGANYYYERRKRQMTEH